MWRRRFLAERGIVHDGQRSVAVWVAVWVAVDERLRGAPTRRVGAKAREQATIVANIYICVLMRRMQDVQAVFSINFLICVH